MDTTILWCIGVVGAFAIGTQVGLLIAEWRPRRQSGGK